MMAFPHGNLSDPPHAGSAAIAFAKLVTSFCVPIAQIADAAAIVTVPAIPICDVDTNEFMVVSETASCVAPF
jgi:hypothetical protein